MQIHPHFSPCGVFYSCFYSRTESSGLNLSRCSLMAQYLCIWGLFEVKNMRRKEMQVVGFFFIAESFEFCDYSEALSRSHAFSLLAQRERVFSLHRKISRLRTI